MAEFHERYVPVAIEVPQLEYLPLVYFNKYSSKVGVGIRRSPSTITIPGVLFTGPRARSSFRVGRKSVAVAAAGEPVLVTFESQESLVDWTIEVSSSPPPGVVGELHHEGRLVTVTLRPNPGRATETEIEEVVVRRDR